MSIGHPFLFDTHVSGQHKVYVAHHFLRQLIFAGMLSIKSGKKLLQAYLGHELIMKQVVNYRRIDYLISSEKVLRYFHATVFNG